MDRSAWLGLLLGVLIGGAYGMLQRWGMRRGAPLERTAAMLAGGVVRLTLFLVVVLLALRLTTANRYWLMGSVMATYAIVFLISMRNVIFKKGK